MLQQSSTMRPNDRGWSSYTWWYHKHHWFILTHQCHGWEGYNEESLYVTHLPFVEVKTCNFSYVFSFIWLESLPTPSTNALDEAFSRVYPDNASLAKWMTLSCGDPLFARGNVVAMNDKLDIEDSQLLTRRAPMLFASTWKREAYTLEYNLVP